MSYLKENIFYGKEEILLEWAGFWLLVSEAVAGVRSHVWRGYWSGLACLASGLVLTTERTRRGWQPLKQREKDIILPAHSLGARMSNFLNTLTVGVDFSNFKTNIRTELSTFYDPIKYYIPTSVAEALSRWWGLPEFLPPERQSRGWEAWLLQCCSVLCQLGDCRAEGTMREEAKSGIG